MIRLAESFQSSLAPHFERFVLLKRSGGAAYRSQAALLRRFDRFLQGRRFDRSTLLEYLESLEHLSPRARDNAIGVVWMALSYAARDGARIGALPPRPPCADPSYRLRPPRILSQHETRAVVAAARRLPPVGSLRPVTYATLFGLLCVTGMRIGEALALDIGDLDLRERLVTVKRGKFGKSRVLPVRPSTIAALRRYVQDPRRPIARSPDLPLFVSGKHSRLSHPAAQDAFRSACRLAALPEPTPRIHDLRHTFAISRVASWYRQQRDVGSLLPVLSTYLGHVSVENTRLYLRANGPLLQHAARLFEVRMKLLDEVLS